MPIIPDRTCPLGDDCDLTVAWMAGAEDARDKSRARIASLEAQLAEAQAMVAAAYESERNQPRPEYALERIRKEARREALEDAAKVADKREAVCWDADKKNLGTMERHCALEAKHIAEKIRALTYQPKGDSQ